MPATEIKFRMTMAPYGWRIVHEDLRRHIFTLERKRRFFKGRYRVLRGEDMVREFKSGITIERAA